MKRWIITLQLVATFGLLMNCGENTIIGYRKHNLGERELLSESTTVVVGVVKDLTIFTKRLALNDQEQPYVKNVRLYKVRISVEQTIKGVPPASDEIDVYFWGVGEFTNAASLNWPDKGQRAIHYLTSEDGSLRYVTDLVRSSTTVFSGRHANEPNTDNASMIIPKLLLSPSIGFAPEEFARNLSLSTYRSQELVGYVGTLPFLRTLLKDSNNQIKWAACRTLHDFIGQDSVCLHEETATHNNSVTERERVELIESNSVAQIGFKKSFLKQPVQYASQYALLPGEEGIIDFLRLISLHPDPELAKRSAEELRKLSASQL